MPWIVNLDIEFEPNVVGQTLAVEIAHHLAEVLESYSDVKEVFLSDHYRYEE